MKSRDLTIDLARGFIVFIMPATHATLYYSQMDVQKSAWGIFLRIFAEGAGAQVFMFLLGFSFYLGRKKSLESILKRSLSIFLLAYLLNFIKFVIPSILGWIPSTFFSYYHLSSDFWGTVDLLMVGDIFQFAALAYLTCGVIYHFKLKWWLPLAVSILTAIVSPFIWGNRVTNIFFDYLLKFLNGAPPAVFFPVFPWLAYPLMGLSFGFLYNALLEEEFYKLCFKVGLLFFAIGMGIMWFEPVVFKSNFYRLGPGGTFFHAGLVLLWLCLCHLLVVRFKENYFNQGINLMSWYSSNITLIYLVQWIIVIYCLPLFGFMDLGIGSTIIAVSLVSLMTFLLVKLLKLFKGKHYIQNVEGKATQ
ncbi:Protein of unknown function [Arachidicoccus rhizosphaerae]|uniref:Heparan-alpha-glucosaminide N-acetyltransferase catalytic domain-containing protein n=1 Tax=Arachidicoccus rhizosphaerae TaxID=551991 RepID=A0A1H4A3A2_9BACT|nr:heparan-alpha-glucosaminide N-acetyltransferase domain-containing protein [Arachidicoccus rhizosphaerae]SEA30350.1 Protein of unknown function [Arachidicoccus rhizosphaerae]